MIKSLWKSVVFSKIIVNLCAINQSNINLKTKKIRNRQKNETLIGGKMCQLDRTALHRFEIIKIEEDINAII